MKRFYFTAVLAAGVIGCASVPTQPSNRQFSKAIGAPVSAALDAMSAKNYDEAIVLLSAVLGDTRGTSYERATVYQMRGMSYYYKDQLPKAREDFERAVATGGLTSTDSQTLRMNIGRLLIAEGQYSAGASQLEALFEEGAVTSNVPEYIMYAWIEDRNYAKALPWAERWIEAKYSPSENDRRVLDFVRKWAASSHTEQPAMPRSAFPMVPSFKIRPSAE